MKYLLSIPFLLSLILFNVGELSASHVVGGILRYECLGQTNNTTSYQVYCSIYRDLTTGGADCEEIASFGLYRQLANGNWEFVDVFESALLGEPSEIEGIDYPCLEEPVDEVRVESCDYSFIINDLEIINQPYMMAYQKCCRNDDIINIFDPTTTGIALTNVISPLAQELCNTNPDFNELPPIFICGGNELSLLQDATDADGDELRYSFCNIYQAGGESTGTPSSCSGITPNPANCLPPFQEVGFTNQYSATTPLAGNPVVKIDPISGQLTGIANRLGRFSVGICVEEFRNGMKIGEIVRDFQFNSQDCEPTVFADINLPKIGNSQYYMKSCGNTTIELINTSAPTSNIESYLWSFNVGGEMVSKDTKDWTITFPDFGSYQGLMIINEGLLCVDTAFISIDVFPPIEANFNIDFDTCTLGPLNLIDQTEAFLSTITDWSWDVNGAVYESQFPTIQITEAGDYLVQLSVLDDNLCSDTSSINMAYYPLPESLSINPSAYKSCAPSLISFDQLNNIVDNNYSIIWHFGDGESSTEVNPQHSYKEPGLYNIELIIESPTGCELSEQFIDLILIEQSPDAAFSYTPGEINSVNNLVSFTNESSATISWQWTFGDDGFSSLENPSHEFSDTGFFDVQLVSFHENACTDTMIQRLNVKPLDVFYFPNAFSPNYDGKNETFKGKGIVEGMNNYQINVWNRWGELVFHTDDPTEGWDGRKNNIGHRLSDGMYVYSYTYFNARNEQKKGKGKVLLLN